MVSDTVVNDGVAVDILICCDVDVASGVLTSEILLVRIVGKFVGEVSDGTNEIVSEVGLVDLELRISV